MSSKDQGSEVGHGFHRLQTAEEKFVMGMMALCGKRNEVLESLCHTSGLRLFKMKGDEARPQWAGLNAPAVLEKPG